MKQTNKTLKITSSQITVALICYQEKESLQFVLEDLKQQTAYKQIGEVLLFQNGFCQKTRETAKLFLNKLPLKILSSPLNNLGLARSEIIKKAEYDWIAWTDSDCRLPKDWLESLISHWNKTNQKNLSAIGGPNRLPEKQLWQKGINLSLNFAIGHGWSPQAWIPKKAQKTSHIPTTNGLFLKQACLKAGNFSHNYSLAGEDLDLGFRLKKQGLLLLFPTPIVINNYASSYWDSLKRLFIFGAIQAQRKSMLFYLSMPFFPVLLGSLIFSFFWKLFLWIPMSYFSLLIGYSGFATLKTRKKTVWLLPFFWFAQHVSYSLGETVGLFLSLKRKQTLIKQKN